jgi:hypothetical protein
MHVIQELIDLIAQFVSLEKPKEGGERGKHATYDLFIYLA